jgi:hypothetical protein
LTNQKVKSKSVLGMTEQAYKLDLNSNEQKEFETFINGMRNNKFSQCVDTILGNPNPYELPEFVKRFSELPVKCRDYIPFVKEVVEIDPAVYKYVAKNARISDEIILIVMKTSPEVFQFASDTFKQNRENAIQAIKSSPQMVQFVSDEIQNETTLIIEVIKECPSTFFLIRESIAPKYLLLALNALKDSEIDLKNHICLYKDLCDGCCHTIRKSYAINLRNGVKMFCKHQLTKLILSCLHIEGIKEAAVRLNPNIIFLLPPDEISLDLLKLALLWDYSLGDTHLNKSIVDALFGFDQFRSKQGLMLSAKKLVVLKNAGNRIISLICEYVVNLRIFYLVNWFSSGYMHRIILNDAVSVVQQNFRGFQYLNTELMVNAEVQRETISCIKSLKIKSEVLNFIESVESHQPYDFLIFCFRKRFSTQKNVESFISRDVFLFANGMSDLYKQRLESFNNIGFYFK